jgi:hypothetical protein
MTTPTIDQITTHQWLHGGLWLIIPARTQAGQPRPLFAMLGVNTGRPTIEGGCLRATVEENQNMQGAEWVPVNSRGERV